MKTLLAIVSLGLVALACVRAEDAPPQIEVKHKSSFTMDASGRNPFWPIGFKPVVQTQITNEHAGTDIPASAFLVSSITLDEGARFAIINGKAMQEGQQFGLQLGNQTYQLTVKRIEDGRVILSRRARKSPKRNLRSRQNNQR